MNYKVPVLTTVKLNSHSMTDPRWKLDTHKRKWIYYEIIVKVSKL